MYILSHAAEPGSRFRKKKIPDLNLESRPATLDIINNFYCNFQLDSLRSGMGLRMELPGENSLKMVREKSPSLFSQFPPPSLSSFLSQQFVPITINH
jgi:hypothetical protein